MQRKTVVVICAAVLMIASEAFAGTVRIVRNDSPFGDDIVMGVVAIFRANCLLLSDDDYWRDLESIEIDVEPEIADYRRAKGWRHTITIRARVSASPQTMPAYHPGAGQFANQTLYYHIGGGRSPGYFASKRASKYLCGIENYDSGRDEFVPVKELKALNKFDR